MVVVQSSQSSLPSLSSLSSLSSQLQVAQLPGAASVRLLAPNGESKAMAIAVRYSSTQAYCVLVQLDDQLQDKQIRIEQLTDDPDAFRIVQVEEEKENSDGVKSDRHLQPLYIQAHTAPTARLAVEHLLDEAGERALGVTNLDLKKNLTIDLWAESSEWRDRVGFLVTDRLQFLQMNIPRTELIDLLRPRPDVALAVVEETTSLLDYDHLVSGMHRGDFLAWLLKTNQALVAADPKTGACLGFLIAGEERVLALYADTAQVADALLGAWLSRTSAVEISLHIRVDFWHSKAFRQAATSAKRVCRRHTRAVPTNIKWDKVFVLNVGLHIL